MNLVQIPRLSVGSRFVTRACLCFLVAGAIRLAAQTTNGSVNGTVVDPSGSGVADVQIDLTSTATGRHRTATSSEGGTYSVPQLPPGTYDISVQKQGFATETRRGVQL